MPLSKLSQPLLYFLGGSFSLPPVLALLRHHLASPACPLPEVKRSSRKDRLRSEFDPEPTSADQLLCVAKVLYRPSTVPPARVSTQLRPDQGVKQIYPRGVFVSGLTRVRTRSIKSCASALSERFFKVMMAIGCRILGSSTGSALSEGCRRGSLSENAGMMVRKRPVASISLRRFTEVALTVSRGNGSPLAR